MNILNSEQSQVIPSIHTQPVRFLGRRIFLLFLLRNLQPFFKISIATLIIQFAICEL